MNGEAPENLSDTGDLHATDNDTPGDNQTPVLETQQESPVTLPVEEAPADLSDSGDTQPEKDQETPVERQEDRVHQLAHESQVGIISAITGAHAHAYLTSIQYGVNGEPQQSLDEFVTRVELKSPPRVYKSFAAASVVGFSGCLQSERILLLSCQDEDVVLSIAKSIAYETNIPNKELVNIEGNCQGRYNFCNLIDSLARPQQQQRPATSPQTRTAIYVWDATDAGDDEIASGILDSLLSANSRVEKYQLWLAERGVCLICLVSPQRVEKYNDSRFARLRSVRIDFLDPLLEHYDQEYETLAGTIRQQRLDGHWSDDEAKFYREISKHLRAGNLAETVQNRAAPEFHNGASVENLFNRHDPLTDTILYCATYFPDLSPRDFSYLVELFLGETTEEITKRISRAEGSELVVESVPLVNRWRREADSLRLQCKLAAARNEDNKLIIDFQPDSLRRGLSKYFRNERPFFYESNFTLMRQQGLLFSPKKAIADGARDLLFDTAKHYSANDVANWLYEIVHEFEEMAQSAERLVQLTPQFQLLPDVRVKAARRYLSYGLSRVLIRLQKDDELQHAARLFWQKLLQTQHQWLIDLLRRMGDSTPPETLKWLKQLLDQGTELTRRNARAYLVTYLLHRDSSIYPTLKELMAWSRSSQAGRTAHEVLILYCAETNRQVAQQDYGRWPSLHPLFGFQDRSEAKECLGLLVSWVWAAAAGADADKALFVIAHLFAGWFFILSSSTSDDSFEVSDEGDGETVMSARVVRNMLFTCLAGHITHGQRNALTEIWDHLRYDILDRIIELDALMNEITGSSLNVDVIAAARRKLVEMRASLGGVRTAFTASAATASAA